MITAVDLEQPKKPMRILLALQTNKTEKWISFYKPNLTIALVDHFQAYQKNAIPPQVSNSAFCFLCSTAEQQHAAKSTQAAAGTRAVDFGSSTTRHQNVHCGISVKRCSSVDAQELSP